MSEIKTSRLLVLMQGCAIILCMQSRMEYNKIQKHIFKHLPKTRRKIEEKDALLPVTYSSVIHCKDDPSHITTQLLPQRL